MNDCEYWVTLALEVDRIGMRERRKSCAVGSREEGNHAVSKIRRAVGMKMAVRDSKRCNTAALRKRLKTGAVVGFLVSFSYNIVVVLGKFLRGGGKPPRLPLSVDGCPENLVNATFASYLTSTSIPYALLENTSFVESLFGAEGGQVDSMQLTTPHPQLK
ncbi:hypothetical protein E2C01_011937 [Portunus trituberculatus]|uniref:Uncharacterized protein n=1 Tax=Portunus trituberculatus TaxID=210409 RepID=A0A5B7DC81_PORTR|nr:hypothetical protein [Portunus trituberculatus]